MKNKHFVYVALAAAALATSCASEDIAEPQKQGQNQGGTRTVTLTASVADDNTTRVGMTKNDTTANFYWQNGDKILVQTKNSGGTTYGSAEFTTTSSAATAAFSGTIAEEEEVAGYAVYPYDNETQQHTFDGSDANTLTYVLPATYDNYKPESKIFGNTSISTNVPMLGKIESGKISFKHLGGLAVIRVDEMPVAEGKLTVIADQQLSGDFAVSDLSAEGAQIATTTASDGNGKVTFTFSGASKGSVGVFYLPLATGSYTNMRFEIKDKDTNTWRVSSYNGTLSIARAGVTAVPLAANDMGLIAKNDDGTYIINNKYKFIDLGLSVLWAETNIGAETAEDAGNYYAWGETEPKENYTEDTYTFAESYKAGVEKLDAAHDAATVNWGAGVRMPTYAEFTEFQKGCKQDLSYTEGPDKVVEDDDETEVFHIHGATFTSKQEGYTSNSIYLPSAGYYDGTTLVTTTAKYNWIQDEAAAYWSSTLRNNYYIYLFLFAEDRFMVQDDDTPVAGCSVRAVADKPTE